MKVSTLVKKNKRIRQAAAPTLWHVMTDESSKKDLIDKVNSLRPLLRDTSKIDKISEYLVGYLKDDYAVTDPVFKKFMAAVKKCQMGTDALADAQEQLARHLKVLKVKPLKS
jgi:hypothetical protein